MANYDLLTVNNDAKTSKGAKKGWFTGVLYGAPGTEADGKTNMCRWASLACLDACLYRSGRAENTASIIAARIRRTLQYLANPAAFAVRLHTDFLKLQKQARKLGLKPAGRVNGTFDIPKLGMLMAKLMPEMQFYDYTKCPKPWLRTRPNYHLTFSYSGENMAECIDAMAHGINVAVVFEDVIPAEWNGWPVIDGDQDDLRFLDPVGVVVGLTVKDNKATRATTSSPFIQIANAA